MRLTVLTYNTALLDLTVAGRTVVSVPHLTARLAAQAAALPAAADILCLQEVFTVAARDTLTAALSATHPHQARQDNHPRRRLPDRPLTHGLLIASRHRLSDIAFTEFDCAPWSTRGLIRQGILSATVHPDGDAPLIVLNLHTTAGALAGPETRHIENVRAGQLRQATELAAVLSRRAGDLPVLLCGDLNAGPQASADNYTQLLAAGWTDPADGDEPITWDPTNPLNATVLYRHCPPQRIDHILLDPLAQQRYRTSALVRTLDTADVDTADGSVPLSDHYAAHLTLTNLT